MSDNDYSTYWKTPLVLSENGGNLLLGSGDVFLAGDFTEQTSVINAFDMAEWSNDWGIVTATENDGMAYLENYDTPGSLSSTLLLPGIPLGVFSTSEAVYIPLWSDSGFLVEKWQP